MKSLRLLPLNAGDAKVVREMGKSGPLGNLLTRYPSSFILNVAADFS